MTGPHDALDGALEGELRRLGAAFGDAAGPIDVASLDLYRAQRRARRMTVCAVAAIALAAVATGFAVGDRGDPDQGVSTAAERLRDRSSSISTSTSTTSTTSTPTATTVVPTTTGAPAVGGGPRAGGGSGRRPAAPSPTTTVPTNSAVGHRAPTTDRSILVLGADPADGPRLDGSYATTEAFSRWHTGFPESRIAEAQGWVPDVVTPAVFAAMTTEQFASYRAIITTGAMCSGKYHDVIVASAPRWLPAIDGAIVVGSEELNEVAVYGPDPFANAVLRFGVIRSGSAAGRTGLFINCAGRGLLDRYGSFEVEDLAGRALSTTDPTFADVPSDHFHPSTAVAPGLSAWPADFTPVVTTADGPTAAYLLVRPARATG